MSETPTEAVTAQQPRESIGAEVKSWFRHDAEPVISSDLAALIRSQRRGSRRASLILI
jgi:hypothetical protein